MKSNLSSYKQINKPRKEKIKIKWTFKRREFLERNSIAKHRHYKKQPK
jgi:hypothetical protein